MKKTVAMMVVTIMSAVAVAIDPVLYVPMEQGAGIDVADLGPGGWTGMNNGNVTWATDLHRGTVLSFVKTGPSGDAVQGGLEFVGYKGVLGGSPRTISMWVKTDQPNVTLCMWGPTATASETFSVNMQDGQLRTQNWAGNSKTTTLSLNDSTWHHLIIIVPAIAEVTIHDIVYYVDNERVDPSTISRNGDGGIINTTAGNNLRIGDDCGDRLYLDFVGLLDDFRIYDVELVEAEVTKIYGEHVQLKSPGERGPASVNVDLQWGTTALVHSTGYDVYLGLSHADVANRVVAPVAVTSPIYRPGLSTGTTYYWRVDAHGTGPHVNDGLAVSPVWSLSTIPPEPFIAEHPIEQEVFPGGTAQFSVRADFTQSYAWYREDNPTTPLGDGATPWDSTISNATTATLTISNVKSQDDARYYCVASAQGDPDAESSHTRLIVKRLVAYYDMDQPIDATMVDRSGEGHDLSVLGGVTYTTGRDGAADGAAWFDGYDDMMIPANGQMSGIPVGDHSYTISAYVRVAGSNSYGGNQAIVGWGGGFDGDPYLRIVAFRIMSDLTRLQELWWNADHVYTPGRHSEGFSDFAERWVHVASVFDRAPRARRFYVNGSMVDKKNEETILQTRSAANFGIGWLRNNWEDKRFPFHGAIDEVRIYNYPLSPSDMAREYVYFTGDDVCFEPVSLDTNGDCIFNMVDLAVLVGNWGQCNEVPTCIP